MEKVKKLKMLTLDHQIKVGFNSIRLVLSRIVGWVKRSATQQTAKNVGFPYVKRHFTQVGKPAHVSGSPTYAG